MCHVYWKLLVTFTWLHINSILTELANFPCIFFLRFVHSTVEVKFSNSSKPQCSNEKHLDNCFGVNSESTYPNDRKCVACAWIAITEIKPETYERTSKKNQQIPVPLIRIWCSYVIKTFKKSLANLALLLNVQMLETMSSILFQISLITRILKS